MTVARFATATFESPRNKYAIKPVSAIPQTDRLAQAYQKGSPDMSNSPVAPEGTIALLFPPPLQ